MLSFIAISLLDNSMLAKKLWKNTRPLCILLSWALLCRISPSFSPTLLYLTQEHILHRARLLPGHVFETLHADKSITVVDVVAVTVSKYGRAKKLKIKVCILVLSLITIPLPLLFPAASLPSGSMTRQESPTTLLHYGEHWWPLDRQPNTIYHQHHRQHNNSTQTLVPQRQEATQEHLGPHGGSKVQRSPRNSTRCLICDCDTYRDSIFLRRAKYIISVLELYVWELWFWTFF